MVKKQKLFSNPFNSIKITTVRLRNFADDVLVRLDNAESNPAYADFISQLAPALAELSNGLSVIDGSVNRKKNNRKVRDEFISLVKTTMSEKQGAIAHFLGGFASPGYAAFYPLGVTEYSAATLTQMPVLVKRISNESVTHAALLGEELSATLQDFEKNWKIASTSLAATKASVGEQRSKRRKSRAAVEKILVNISHSIAQKFEGNEEECSKFFDFNLLYSKSHGKRKTKPPVDDKEKPTTGIG